VPAFDWLRVMRPRFFAGFHRCIRGMADAGNDLIVDHVIEFADWRAELAALLGGLDVFLVGVHCDPAELERRELARGDRRPGEALGHLQEDRIHELGPYDLEVDTTAGVSGELVERIAAAWRARAGRSALFSD
jgi:chloramphenicol 3-O phosphotransferase